MMDRKKTLFVWRDEGFILHSGDKTKWIIDCSALGPGDWSALARMAVSTLPPFGGVVGVPQGGVSFAHALTLYATKGPLLIADDVLTTGASMEEFRRKDPHALGIVVFARGPVPSWIRALFLWDGDTQYGWERKREFRP